MTDVPPTTAAALDHGGSAHVRQLSPLLVWAVVFADIGTSIYYVPGLLYGQVGDVAPFFVATVMIGFLFLAAKYVEICWRNPDGGGVVSIASQAFTPTWGAVGGLMIIVDYFLTAAISVVSGVKYLGSVYPAFADHDVLYAVLVLVMLAVVNIIGIKESATLSLLMAVLALAVNVVLIGMILYTADDIDWQRVRENVALAKDLGFKTFMIGFGGAWLAFSGLESISQLSPAMKLPIRGTAKRGMLLVVATIIITAPLLTLFAIALLSPEVKGIAGDHMISALAAEHGGRHIELAVVVTATTLLLFAANTAIIGCYHVFLALSKNHYLPSTIGARNRRFRTPHIAIVVSIFVPSLVVLFSAGDTHVLGELYAFGLLGAFVLSSISLDVVRWRENRRGAMFWLGAFTTVLVVTAWLVNLHEKQAATLFGSLLVGIGLFVAVGTRRKWFANYFYAMPAIARRTLGQIAVSEHRLEELEGMELLTLSQAHAVSKLYPSKTLVAMRSPNEGLVAEAILREKGLGGNTVYALYIEERTGLFVGGVSGDLTGDCVDSMKAAVRAAEREGFNLIPIWTVSHDAVEGIVRAAETLGVNALMVGVSQRGAIYGLLRGHVVEGLSKRLPQRIRLLLFS